MCHRAILRASKKKLDVYIKGKTHSLQVMSKWTSFVVAIVASVIVQSIFRYILFWNMNQIDFEKTPPSGMALPQFDTRALVVILLDSIILFLVIAKTINAKL